MAALILTPVQPNGQIQHAEAFVVTVAGGHGTIQETISAAANTLTAAMQDAFFIKEFTLDGIAHGIAKLVLKSMTQSILNWINSGFQGSPAFVTDLQQYLRDRVDQVVGDYIYNDPGLNFLCSPFQLDVKIALATTYQEQAHEGIGSKAQCTLSDVTDNVEGFLNGSFSDGGWSSWFEVTQNPVNTPTGALLEAKTEMYARIVDEQGEEIQQLSWGDGFLSFKVCADTETKTNCNITTPGRVIADQINKSLGAGQDALISADEINEIISALFAQLAQRAITGINGLLGLGSSSYSSNTFGSSGNSSYLDALAEEVEVSDGIENPFIAALEREKDNIDLQQEIISLIDAAESRYDNAFSLYGSCIGNIFPDTLITQRDNAQTRIILDNQHIQILNQMNNVYTSTTSPSVMNEQVTELTEMQRNGELTGLTENHILRVEIDYTLKETISEFNSDLNRRISACLPDDH